MVIGIPTGLAIVTLGGVLVSLWVTWQLYSVVVTRDSYVHGSTPMHKVPGSISNQKVLKGDVMIFLWVSDCTGYQEWQSQVLIWSIYRHHGPYAAITRLISGCDEAGERNAYKTHATLWPSSQYRTPTLFFTPAHIRNEELNETYPPYNRPHSTLLWVQTDPLPPETMVVFLDPDMALLAPLELPLQAYTPLAANLYRQSAPLAEAQKLRAVGQRYLYMSARWDAAKLQLKDICEPDAEGCLRLTQQEVAEFYAVGPPWIMRFEDLQRAAPLWEVYTPRIRKQYQQLIAEMYAHSLAMASINVPYALFDHFVVTYPPQPVVPPQQGWQWIDESPHDPCEADVRFKPPSGTQFPIFLHYCEVYYADDWYFMKRNVKPSTVLSCGEPLLGEPPSDLHARKVRSRSPEDDHHADWDRTSKRQTWYLCVLLSVINAAAVDLRGRLCPSGFNTTKELRYYPKGALNKALRDFFMESALEAINRTRRRIHSDKSFGDIQHKYKSIKKS